MNPPHDPLRQPSIGSGSPSPSDLPDWDHSVLSEDEVEVAYERIFGGARSSFVHVQPEIPEVPSIDEVFPTGHGRRASRTTPDAPPEPAPREAAQADEPETRRGRRGRRVGPGLSAEEEAERARRLAQRIAEAPPGSRLARRREQMQKQQTHNPDSQEGSTR